MKQNDQLTSTQVFEREDVGLNDDVLAAVKGGTELSQPPAPQSIADRIWPQLPLPVLRELPAVDSTWLTPEDVLPSKSAADR